MSDSLRPHESQHARPPCPSATPRVHSDSRPLSQWCHPAISSSVVPFSSGPQSLPASESFPMSQLFASGGQSTGVSALVSSFQRNPRADLLQNGLVGSPCSPRDSQVFFNTTVQKHQFFGTQPSSQSNSHIHTWPLEKSHGTTDWFQVGKGVHQGFILSPCLFNLHAEYIMRNTGLDEAQAGIKIARRNINNLRYADDTTLMAESEEN